MIQSRFYRIVLGLLAGLLISLLFLLGHIVTDQSKEDPRLSVTATDFGGPFTLVNQDGQTVTEKDFEGTWRLIYFGFTYCPAICPTELQKISTVLKDLGTRGDSITPIFISVDPERDTVSVMKQYISLFHPRLVGLTGSVEQIEQVKKSYKVFAAKVQDETMTDYTVDHSSFIYFLNPDNDLVKIFRLEDTADEMEKIIREALIFDNRV